MSLPHKIYVDGGVIGRNPSALGGTWAWVWVDKKDRELRHDSGIITPKQAKLDKITNNYTELYAALEGLASVGNYWDGIIYTDSLITLRRITYSMSFKNIPNSLKEKALELRKDREWDCILVKGHPTKKDLLRGTCPKGTLVSRWNVFCDRKCKHLAREFKENLED